MEAKWYESSGDWGDIAVSSRIRLARNLADYPFPARLSASGAKEILEKVSGCLSEEGLNYLELGSLGPNETGALVERHLISPELAGKGGSCGVCISADERISVMINEEDHLRIQVLGSGLCLSRCLEEASALDDRLESRLPYAWDERLGYLTHCPTNLGTGLRASVMLHLPAHRETGEIRSLIAGLTKLGFAVRGFFGEGSAAAGGLYQISNQMTLGPTEAETVERLEKAVCSTIERERALRRQLRDKDPLWHSDRVWRAYGILKHARRISSGEAMELLSDLRTGVGSEEMPQPELGTLNRLLRQIQPHHLSLTAGESLTEHARDSARATLLRENIG